MLIFFFWDQVFACWVKPTPLRASFKSPISCTKSNTWSARKDSPVSKTVFSFFGGDQVFASQIKTTKELCRVKPTPLRVSYKSPISCTKSNTWSAHKDSPVSERFYTLFLGTKSLHHRSRLRKSCVGWNQLLCRSALSHPSLVQSQTPDQRIKTVQFPKCFILFFWDQVFASQIKTKEEFCKVTPTPLQVSFKSPISFSKSNTWSAHEDSPVSKTVFSSFFGDQVFASQIKTKKELCRVKPTPLQVSFKSPISCTKSNTWSAHKDSPVSEMFYTLFWGPSLCITDQD